MVHLLEHYFAVLFQVVLQNVNDYAFSKPKKRKKKRIQTHFFFLFWSMTTVTPCICFYFCDSSMNMLFFSMLVYSSVVCIWDRGSQIKWVIFRCLIILVSFSSYKFYSAVAHEVDISSMKILCPVLEIIFIWCTRELWQNWISYTIFSPKMQLLEMPMN